MLTCAIVSEARFKELKDQFLKPTMAMIKDAFKTDDDLFALAERMIILTAIHEQQEAEIIRLTQELTSKTK